MIEHSTASKRPEQVTTRVLNVAIPEPVYWHIRKCATESKLSMKDFMARFCSSATPLTTIDTATALIPDLSDQISEVRTDQ